MNEVNRTANRLGKELEEMRERMRMNVEDVARGVQAPADFVSSLEKNNYDNFSAKVYARGFLRKILDFYSLESEEKNRLLATFDQEWEVVFPSTNLPIIKNKNKFPVLTLGRLSLALGGLVLAVFFILSGSRILSFIFPPRFSIKEPADEIFLEIPRVRISGITEKESRLSVNGREFKIDDKGYFSEEIELLRGFNTLNFLVQNRFGKINSAIRHIVVKNNI